MPVTNLVGVEGGAFKQTMRQLEHERGGIDRLVSNQALFKMAVERADTSDPIVRQRIAALEIGYRLGRILVTREVLGQAPKGFSAATKCFCTEHEWRVAEFVASVFGAAATTCGATSRTDCCTRRATRSWAARRTSCATSSASGCSGCRANPR